MFKGILYGLATATLLATPALAELKYVSFSIKRGDPLVKGRMVVDGYTVPQITKMMGVYCKGRPISDFTFKGKPRKKRGYILQKFTATCATGPLDRFKGSSGAYEIEYITKGEYKNKHLVEITTSDGNGNIVYLREFARP